MRYLFTIALLFILGYAQCGNNVFKYLTSKDGLDEGTINDIAQDSSGLMWFATYDGLIQYDGYRFRTFRPEIGNEMSIPSKKTTGLFLDSRNNLWITLGGNDGIVRYDAVKELFHSYEVNFQHSTSRLYDIVEIDGMIITNQLRSLHYISLDQVENENYFEVLKIYDEKKKEFSTTNNIRKIDDYLLIINRNNNQNYTELLFAEIQSDNHSVYAQIIRRETLSGLVFDVYKLPVDDMICFAMKEGFQIYSFQDSFTHLTTVAPAEHFTKILREDNKIWLATKKNGVYNYDLHKGMINRYHHDPTQPRSLLSDIVFSMYRDFTGNLWFGHGEDGLSILNSHSRAFSTFQSNPASPGHIADNSILSFCEVGNDILIGTRHHGINIMRNAGSEAPWFENIHFPASFIKTNHDYESVWDIKKESDNVIWMATSYGLVKAINRRGDWVFEQIFSHQQVGLLRRIFIDDNRNIWFGGFTGLYLMPYSTRDSGIFYHYAPDVKNPLSLSNVVVSDIILSSSGSFYIATMEGMNILNNNYYDLNMTGLVKPELSFTRHLAGICDKTMSNNEINSFFEYSDGTIWICTQGGGINIFDEVSKRFSFIEEKDGLSSNNIFGILKDRQNRLWLSTSRGITCVTGTSEKRKFKKYTVDDGLQGNIFLVNAYYASRDGKVYFGGRNGFTSFYPDEIRENNVPPRIRFSSIALNGVEVSIGEALEGRIIFDKSLDLVEEIKLPHNLNSLSIGVNAIHYQNPENNTLMFRLENFDENWLVMPADKYYIRYPALPPGRTYVLRVRGVGANNIMSEMERVLKIQIQARWWETNTARAGFVFIFLLIVFSIAYLLIHREKLKTEIKLDSIKIKEDQKKLDFFTNISHDLRTPLSLISAPIKDLRENLNEYDRSFLKQQLSLIDRNVESLLRLANQLLTFDRYAKGTIELNLQRLDFGNYVSHIVENFRRLQIDDERRLKLFLPAEKIYVQIDPDKFEQVINNVLSNAYKHSKDNADISVSLIKSNRSELKDSVVCNAELTIFNQGREISPDKLEKIFERYYQEKPLNQGGIGIGLAIAKSIIDIHNGHIRAESITNKGVAFHIAIPAMTDEEPFVENKISQYYPGLNDYSSKNIEHIELVEIDLPEDEKIKILVIEDNKELRLFFKSVLSRHFDYYEASDGREGVKIAEEEIPDLIISDVLMPVMNGYEVCSHIKESIITCHIPVILLTAKGSHEDIIEGYGVGADAYVVKPFEINLLLSQINSLIENRRAIQERYRKRGFDPEFISNEHSGKDEIFLKKLRRVIMENAHDQNFNVNMLSESLNICPTYLYRKLKALTGYSPVDLIKLIRLNNALQLIKTNRYAVKEVCYMSGFNNFSYFIRCFRKQFGVTPSMINKIKAGDEGISLN